jgi:hypothetical protein
MTLAPHPLANIFPLLDGEAFEALVADIREHGLREPVILYEGQILDGRNRYRACAAAGVDARLEMFSGDDPLAFVVSKNLHRRHLNESQRAMVATKLATIRDGSHGNRDDVLPKFKQHTQDEAAKLLNVSRYSVQSARVVHERGTDEERQTVERGEASVNAIADQIRKRVPPDKRRQQRAAPLSGSGRNPERIQRMQIKAEVWGRIRDALTHLTSLPLPADAVAIARALDRTGLVDARLDQSITWLKEFADAWSNRNQDAA